MVLVQKCILVFGAGIISFAFFYIGYEVYADIFFADAPRGRNARMFSGVIEFLVEMLGNKGTGILLFIAGAISGPALYFWGAKSIKVASVTQDVE